MWLSELSLVRESSKCDDSVDMEGKHRVGTKKCSGQRNNESRKVGTDTNKGHNRHKDGADMEDTCKKQSIYPKYMQLDSTICFCRTLRQ